MNIYQKKIVKENDIFFLDECVQQIKNNNKNIKTGMNLEIPTNLNVRKFYGISSKLMQKNETTKNNRHNKSKSQIFNTTPIIDNLIPPEIKTIIIKLDNQKEQNKKNISEKQPKNIINIRNNNFNTNFISFFMPSPEKEIKHTRNKSVILNNKNENISANISVNTNIYKKSYCLDKQNKIKTQKSIERATTAPKLIKNISSPDIHNIIDLSKNKNKNTNIYQNISINNNINNVNVLQYDLTISPDKKNNLKISEIFTSRNSPNKKDISKDKNFGSVDCSFPNKINKKIKNVTKCNEIIDKMNKIFSKKNLENKYINVNNNKQFILNKINLMKKGNLLNAVNISQKDIKNKVKCIYTNKNGNKNKINKIKNKKEENPFKENNPNNVNQQENIEINIKNNKKINKIKSIPLKINNSFLFSTISSK